MPPEKAITIKHIQPGTTQGRQSWIVRYGVEGRQGDSVFNLTRPGPADVFVADPRVSERTDSGETRRYRVGIDIGLQTIATVHVERGSAEIVPGDDAITDLVTGDATVEGRMGQFSTVESIACVAAAVIETPLSREPDGDPETFQDRLVVTLGRTRMSPPHPRA